MVSKVKATIHPYPILANIDSSLWLNWPLAYSRNHSPGLVVDCLWRHGESPALTVSRSIQGRGLGSRRWFLDPLGMRRYGLSSALVLKARTRKIELGKGNYEDFKMTLLTVL